MNFQQYKADTCIPLKKAWSLGEVKLEALVRRDYPGRAMPHQMLSGVNSIGYWDAQAQQNWGLDWHRNEGVELTFLETGTLAFSVEGQTETLLHANGLTITRPWQKHKVGNPNIGLGRLYWIILDVGVRRPHQPWKWPDWIILSKKDLDELTMILRQNEQPVWYAQQKTCEYFCEIGKAVKEDNAGECDSRLKILINELLLNILNMFRKKEVLLDKTLTESMRSTELFLTDLPDNLDKHWTLESMAKYCGLGTTSFVYYCKKITNKSPLQYLNYIRLKAAAKMLEEYPDLNIQHIAYDCGYTSSQYFATAFKKQYGKSPKDYRRIQF